MFAQGKGRAGQTNVFGAHDLEGFCVLEHPVLVNAGLMRKRVLTDDGLVELHREARHGRHTARDLHDLLRVDASRERHDVVADLHRHDDLFQRGIACAFAKPVDRAFDLTCTRFDCSKAVGGRHAQIVVTVRGENHLVGPGHGFDEAADQVGGFTRCRVSNRIGNVDRRGSGLDRDFDHAAEIVPFRACRVHRRPLNVVTQVPRMGDGLVDAFGHLVLRQVRDRAVQR